MTTPQEPEVDPSIPPELLQTVVHHGTGATRRVITGMQLDAVQNLIDLVRLPAVIQNFVVAAEELTAQWRVGDRTGVMPEFPQLGSMLSGWLVLIKTSEQAQVEAELRALRLYLQSEQPSDETGKHVNDALLKIRERAPKLIHHAAEVEAVITALIYGTGTGAAV